MIESRRRSHFDARWHINGLRPRDCEDDRAPTIRKAGDADAGVPQDVNRFPRQRHELVAAAGEGGPSIQSWENEEGRYSRLGDRSFTVVRLVPIASVS